MFMLPSTPRTALINSSGEFTPGVSVLGLFMHVTTLPGVTCAPEVRESISESLLEKVVCMEKM